MFYAQRMKQILERLRELDELDFPMYQDYGKRIETKEFIEERDLIMEYRQYQVYENSISPFTRHNQIIVDMYILGASILQQKINYLVAGYSI